MQFRIMILIWSTLIKSNMLYIFKFDTVLDTCQEKSDCPTGHMTGCPDGHAECVNMVCQCAIKGWSFVLPETCMNK